MMKCVSVEGHRSNAAEQNDELPEGLIIADKERDRPHADLKVELKRAGSRCTAVHAPVEGRRHHRVRSRQVKGDQADSAHCGRQSVCEVTEQSSRGL